jgi:hypothetical protein
MKSGDSRFEACPWQKISEIPISTKQLGAVAYAYHPKLWGRLKLGRLWFQANLDKKCLWHPIVMGRKSLARWHALSSQLQQGSLKIGGSWSRQAWGKSETLFPKQPEQKVLEVWLECLPRKCKALVTMALSSNPSIAVLPHTHKHTYQYIYIYICINT